MELERLRSWVRGELGPRDRRDVTRWILRTTDHRLPGVLTALTREWEEEQADQKLLDRRADRAWLVDAWQWALRQGAAALSVDVDATPGLQLLDTSEDVPDPLTVQEVGPDRVDVTVHLQASASFTVFAAPDGGEVVRLIGQDTAEGAQRPFGYQSDPGDGRTTFWLFVGGVPTTIEDALAAARTGALTAHAVRWWPTD